MTSRVLASITRTPRALLVPLSRSTSDTSEYGLVVYTLGPCALHALARLFGQDVMATFLHDYAVEHSLGWSTTAAFKEEAQAVANSLPEPIDLTSFWKRWRIVG